MVTAETLRLHRGLAVEKHRANLQDLGRRLSLSGRHVPMPEALGQWLESRRPLPPHVAFLERRYGDRVLGTPQDPALRALSLATPFVIAGLALAFGVFTFVRWRGRPRLEPIATSSTATISDDYRQQLERDLRE